MTWISVKSALPSIGKKVLATDGEEMNVAYLEPRYYIEEDTSQFFWTYYDYLEWHHVSHWMELPELPNDLDI